MLKDFLHYGSHFIAIGGIAYALDKKQWKKYWLILALTMLVDLDHLLASPIFDPNRCSINFHPLHSYYAIAVYALGLVLSKKKWIQAVFIGLLFHMLTDWVDCFI